MDFEYRSVIYNGSQVPVPIPSSYKYRRCDATIGEIRLLEVHSALSSDQPIQCTLKHYDLNDPPYFAALSYEWGDPSQWQLISLDSVPFPATLNLVKALQQLRLRKCPLLWVDAICINQNDEKERSEHVIKMRDIYHSAADVAIWLGDASNGSEKVMQMLNAIDRSRDPSKSQGHQPWTPSWQHLQDLKPELLAFLQRSYWGRAWILQEVATASSVRLLCGSQTVGWRGLEELVNVVVQITAFPDSNLRHVEHVCKTRLNRVTGLPTGLLEAICSGSETKATDFHDKVYALLGLAFDRELFLPRISYSWSSSVMCVEMTKSWIQSRKLLDIILAGGKNTKSGAGLPSWVPDYLSMRDSRLLRKLSIYLAGQNERYRCGQKCRKWAATGTSVVSAHERIIVDGRFLRVQGICVGIVNGLGAILGDPKEPINGPNSMWKNERPEEALNEAIDGSLAMYDKEFEDIMDKASFTEFLYNFDSLAYGFWNINVLKSKFGNVIEWRERNRDFDLRGRSLGKRGSTMASMLVDFDALLTIPRVLSAVSSIGDRTPGTRASRDPWRGIKKRSHDSDMTAALQSFSDLIEEDLRLMLTDFGDVGWVHPAAEIGDMIVLLRGCSVPVIIRSTNDTDKTYKLIGHAYGHGIMFGEAWSTVNAGELQNFVLS